MPSKTLSLLSALLTIVLLVVVGALSFFFSMVLLNGFGDREGNAALTTLLVCHGVGMLLSAILSGGVTRLLRDKFNWNAVATVLISTGAGTLLGTLLSFGALIISLAVADAMWNAK